MYLYKPMLSQKNCFLNVSEIQSHNIPHWSPFLPHQTTSKPRLSEVGSQAVVERLQRLGARRKASLGDEASGLCLKIGMIRYDTDIRSTVFFLMGILEDIYDIL